MITLRRLRELLNYDPLTGVFTWLVATSNRVQVGDEAGTINAKGYRIIKIDGRLYRAHRLAWLYVHGTWPALDVDHIDKIRHHNWLSNLRLATNQQNHANQKASKGNVTGHKGVSLSRGLYKAQITINGKNKFLGRFPTPELASAAYLKAAIEAFGEYATV